MRAIKGRVIHVGETEKGRVGVVPLGLADGYRPPVPGAPACALAGGERVPIRGVSLEYISVDLSRFGNVVGGDEAVLLGRSGGETITLAELAGWVAAAPHEVLMSFEGRLHPRYAGG